MSRIESSDAIVNNTLGFIGSSWGQVDFIWSTHTNDCLPWFHRFPSQQCDRREPDDRASRRL